MNEPYKPPKRPLKLRIRSALIRSPWSAAALMGRIFYGFRVEGKENVPKEGPYVVWVTEQGLIGMLLSGYIALSLLEEHFSKSPVKPVTYMQEELWALEYFKKALGPKARGAYRPLIPHSAGRLVFGLLDGYRALNDKGIVVLNPEGEATWDGMPVPIKRSIAWFALRTAAPLLPTLPNMGCYEIWPRWQAGPSRRGRLSLTVGKPFKLVDEPMSQVSDEDVDRALVRIRAEYERIVYGSQGVSGWAGPNLRHGKEVDEVIEIRPPSKPLAAIPRPEKEVPIRKRGVAQLLWQCPVCRTDESLLHLHPRFRTQSVMCQACGTHWELKPVPGHDFRLKVTAGEPDLLGLDMPLSAWYQYLKRNFRPTARAVAAVDLWPGEQVHQERSGVELAPYRPNPLFNGWSGRQPPKAQPSGRHQLADWETVGEGRLLLTSHRLLWQGPPTELDFEWSSVTAVYLWMTSTLGIKYGSASYRFNLGNVFALKWLFYAGEMARKHSEADGHTLTVSNY
ncbi:MAG TPA: hypothetical protein PKO09_06290 [Anaerolineae bacterium]|nr:hypothetical protein [Anaerolineae bacterium]